MTFGKETLSKPGVPPRYRKPTLPPRPFLLAILGILALAGVARADTVCGVYPDEAGTVVGPLLNMGAPAGSIGIEITAGSGAVGSYQVQKTNGEKFFNDGAVVSSEGVTNITPVNAQRYRILMTVAPDPGTTVKVCLFLSNPR